MLPRLPSVYLADICMFTLFYLVPRKSVICFIVYYSDYIDGISD